MSSDDSLIVQMRAREHKAMTEIFDRYSNLVFSVALRVLKDAGLAEDVMQEIFFQLWKNPDRFAPSKGSLAAWLAVVARNRAIDLLRQRRPSDSVDEVVLAATTNLESEAERANLIGKIRGVLKQLPPEQQNSLEMAFFEGLTHVEIAAKTGEPLGTVKTRIRSALSSVRKRLET